MATAGDRILSQRIRKPLQPVKNMVDRNGLFQSPSEISSRLGTILDTDAEPIISETSNFRWGGYSKPNVSLNAMGPVQPYSITDAYHSSQGVWYMSNSCMVVLASDVSVVEIPGVPPFAEVLISIAAFFGMPDEISQDSDDPDANKDFVDGATDAGCGEASRPGNYAYLSKGRLIVFPRQDFPETRFSISYRDRDLQVRYANAQVIRAPFDPPIVQPHRSAPGTVPTYASEEHVFWNVEDGSQPGHGGGGPEPVQQSPSRLFRDPRIIAAGAGPAIIDVSALFYDTEIDSGPADRLLSVAVEDDIVTASGWCIRIR